jgi:hypothetical protein
MLSDWRPSARTIVLTVAFLAGIAVVLEVMEWTSLTQGIAHHTDGSRALTAGCDEHQVPAPSSTNAVTGILFTGAKKRSWRGARRVTSFASGRGFGRPGAGLLRGAKLERQPPDHESSIPNRGYVALVGFRYS